MTRELKLALIIGVTFLLGVAVLISDHLSEQRNPALADALPGEPALVPRAVNEPAVEPLVDPLVDGRAAPSGSKLPTDSATPSKPGTPRLALGEVEEIDEPTTIQQGNGGGIRRGSERSSLPPAAQLVEEPIDGGTQIAPRRLSNRWAVSEADFSEGVRGSSSALGTSSGTRTHTILAGDSAYKLARQYLGDGKYFKQIVDANPKVFGNSGQVKIGSEVVIPSLEAARPGAKASPTRLADATIGKPAGTKADKVGKIDSLDTLAKLENQAKQARLDKQASLVKPAALAKASYTVRKGDTLSSIARNQLGSTGRAEEIMRLNKSLIKDPDSLPMGLAILLPNNQ